MIASILGVGTSRFARQPETHPSGLVWQAVAEALEEAEHPRIDAVYLGTVFGAPGVAQRALHPLGITEIPIITVENACASGTTAFHEAVASVAAGRFEHVLAVGVEKMTDNFSGPIIPESSDLEGRTGLALPALYAMAASRYLAVHDVSEYDLAGVAVKNHGNGLLNPRSQSRPAVDHDAVLNSRMIADPLTLLQCCPISDGAAAAVIGPASSTKPTAVKVRSSTLRSGTEWDQEHADVWGYSIIEKTAASAYEAAGVGPREVDVIECHDAFTIGEIVTTEALGLAGRGEGATLIRSKQTAIDGATPVNPSGGLLARGHPLGATGLAQIAEISWQLRGRAGERQIPGARLGLVETMGGGVSGIDGNACVVAILER